MTTPNLSLAHLEHLLVLTKKKLALSLDLEKIEQKIAGFFGSHEPISKAKAPTRRGKPRKVSTGKSSKKTPRGTLKPNILAVLREAGKDGLSVAEVAEKIGAKKGSVNVWFYTTGKKVEGLKKVARGRFALKG